MATWRRKALEAFPGLRRELSDHGYTYYSLFFDLLPMVRTARDEADEATLRKIYDFAEWCFRQAPRASDLSNAVCVAFYEHLFDWPRLRPAVVPWLSPAVIEACQPLWTVRLTKEELSDLRDLLRSRIMNGAT